MTERLNRELDLREAAMAVQSAQASMLTALRSHLATRGQSTQLAQSLGISKAYLSEMKHGGRKISDGVVEKLARME